METKVQKWGNSLALRIPKPFAAQVGIKDDSSVQIDLIAGSLVITPIVKPHSSLDELLARITEKNKHGEVPTGTAVGNELW